MVNLGPCGLTHRLVETELDGDLQIMDVATKWPGSVHNSRILRISKLNEKFRERDLSCLPDGVFLGDSGYPFFGGR